MSQSKILKIVDRNGCSGRTIRELRKVLRGIESGEIIGMNFITIKRNGGMTAYTDCDDSTRALGAADLLKEYIRRNKFETF